MKWWALLIQKSLYDQMVSIQAVSAPHIKKCSYINAQSHQPVLCMVIPCCLSVWPGKLEPFTCRPLEHLWMSDRPVNEASVKVDC